MKIIFYITWSFGFSRICKNIPFLGACSFFSVQFRHICFSSRLTNAGICHLAGALPFCSCVLSWQGMLCIFAKSYNEIWLSVFPLFVNGKTLACLRLNDAEFKQCMIMVILVILISRQISFPGIWEIQKLFPGKSNFEMQSMVKKYFLLKSI